MAEINCLNDLLSHMYNIVLVLFKLIKMVRSDAFQSRLLSILKSTILRIVNQQHQKLFPTFFSNTIADVHDSTKIDTFTFYKGALGQAPRRERLYFKQNQTQRKLFL